MKQLSLKATKESRERWQQRLYAMRSAGSRRARQDKPSASLLPLLDKLPKGAAVLDLGCGESGDYRIARHYGLRAYRVDLFPPSTTEFFVQADVLDLPFTNESIDGAACHAVLSLLAPFDRWNFYEEVARILKPDGLFSMTPYSLADGFSVKTKIEREKCESNGLHRVSGNLYRKCSDQACDQHPANGSLEAFRQTVNAIDTDPVFRHVALILLSWFTHDWSIDKTVAFTGKSKSEVKKVIQGMIDCGIFDPNNGSLDIPWFDYSLNDEIADSNVSLVLDVLAIEGRIKRWRDEKGQLLYAANPEVEPEQPKYAIEVKLSARREGLVPMAGNTSKPTTTTR